MSRDSAEIPDRRRERSRLTRRRIVEAAYRLFSERGYGVALAEVAAAAGVSVQNLYLLFSNKQRLVQATLELAVLGDDSPVPPHERPWFRELAEAADPEAAIRIWVENTLPIYARVAPLAGMFLSEPSLESMWAHSEKLRVEGFRHAMEVVARKGRFPPGMNLDRATDIMFVLLSPVVYSEFVRGRGWSASGWSEWASHALAGMLFTGSSPGTP
jgi:AcrR family transcriptional regulator